MAKKPVNKKETTKKKTSTVKSPAAKKTAPRKKAATKMPLEKEKTQHPVANQEVAFGEMDTYLYKQGSHFSLYNKLGSHETTVDGQKGTQFAVWAPNASSVSVFGNFNYWNKEANFLSPRADETGIWEGFVPGIGKGEVYKYFIKSDSFNFQGEKTDPVAKYYEIPPKTASVVWDLEYEWNDTDWMKKRAEENQLEKPMSVYEMHIGSWRTKPEEGNRPLSYRELATELTDYAKEMGFTHVEFMPVMEHPFAGSWGYQVLGFFAPTSRFGTPQDFMYLVDTLHQNGIGVIVDWVPSHFPGDAHGIAEFDGTRLYEHQDPRKGFHPDWKSYIFNYDRNEVREFLISSAACWLDKYHIDGLRVDAVASMLYLDYSREEGEWIPNEHGGRENLGAISFLQRLNEIVYERFPGAQTIAEESTSWPMVSRPTYIGGLGFGMKWNMGWMHDTLDYFSKDPVHRKYEHNKITFSIWYAFSENFMLSLSHDEVVYGKGSLINKMPGDDWQKFAGVRSLFGYMFTHPGKKLFFMGGELGQYREWNHESSLDWHLLDEEKHKGLNNWVKDLNTFYKNNPALYEKDFEEDGFQWIEANDSDNNVLSYIRKGKNTEDQLIVVCNFSPIPRHNYRVGVPFEGYWKEVLNSDSNHYGGSDVGNMGGVKASPVGAFGHYYSLNLTVPPMAMVVFKKE